MPCSLHSANQNASPSVCVVRDDYSWPVAHDANMDIEGINYLKDWRELAGLTQEQLAEAVGTTKAVISLLENEKRPLSSKWLRKLAVPLKTRPGYLLDVDPSKVNPDVIDIYINGDPEQRRLLADVAKALVRTGTDG